MQHFLYQRASAFLKEHTKELTTRAEFEQFFTPKDAEKPEIHGGFAKVYYAADSDLEKEIKEKLNVTIRCIPFDQPKKEGTCIFTGVKTDQQVIFAKSY
jgi:prolyl-tRNA synthetase